MKTDDLIALLAAQAQPVPRRAARRQLALAVAAALPLSVLLMLAGYGLRPGLAGSLLHEPMALVKLLAPAAVAVAAFVAAERLARPGVPAGAAWLGAPAEARPGLLMGRTWRTCALSISGMALPVFAAAFLALRSQAPTRPALAGAAAGALAAGAGAAVYALHCPELAAPFLAAWYVLGMAIPVLAGAVLGRALLRW